MYNVAVIGAGIAGIFLAYELASSGQKVVVLDRGKKLADRRACPKDRGNTCNCEVCDNYYGFGGLGKSEGKFNYSNGFGGQLEQKVGSEIFRFLMRKVDDMLCRFGGDKVTPYTTYDPQLFQRAEEAGLKVISTEVRHLGTNLSIEVFQQIYEYLKNKIDFRFQCEITSIHQQKNQFIISTDKETIFSDQVVISTGRSGNDWLDQIWKSFEITPSQTRLDLGIRVEMKAEQFRSILQDTFETKLVYQAGDHIATTYCMNPQGRIIRKYQEGLVMPDGQNYREQGEGATSNLNFTLFVPRYFSTTGEADSYARSVIEPINQGTDRIVVQRWGDFIAKKASTSSSIQQNSIIPTLDADGGNLFLEVPNLYLHMFQEFMDRLEMLLGEPIDKDTLLYGIDAKFYSAVVTTNSYFETNIPQLYAVGDCSGVTHSLSQAAASGLYAGMYLKRNWQERS